MPLSVLIALLLGSAAGGALYGVMAPRSCLYGPVISCSKNTASAAVALTFDDGPSRNNTPQILDILAATETPAAFFVIGSNAEKHSELVRRMHHDGHIVASHSYDHPAFGMFFGARYWQQQLLRTDAVIEQIIGRRPLFFRPPMGFKQHFLMHAVRGQDKILINWNRRGLDGIATEPEKIYRRLAPRVRTGDIIALHDGYRQYDYAPCQATVAILPRLIKTLRSRGFTLTRLDHLLSLQPYRSDGSSLSVNSMIDNRVGN